MSAPAAQRKLSVALADQILLEKGDDFERRAAIRAADPERVPTIFDHQLSGAQHLFARPARLGISVLEVEVEARQRIKVGARPLLRPHRSDARRRELAFASGDQTLRVFVLERDE